MTAPTFPAGAEHTSSRPAVIQVLRGELALTLPGRP